MHSDMIETGCLHAHRFDRRADSILFVLAKKPLLQWPINLIHLQARHKDSDVALTGKGMS